MNNKPNPELIDEENPKWNEAVEGFKRGWQEILRGEYYPIETLWDDIDFTINGE
jgi:hypothetical protein